jgi:hypothetical protein
MEIKKIKISNFGNIQNQTINIDQNIILLESKEELLTLLKWFMNIEMIDSLNVMNNLLNERSTINIDFVDTKNNLIRYSEYKDDKMFNRNFSIGNFTTSNFLTDAFSEHFFPQEYSDYTFLDIERGYSDNYIAEYVERLKNLVNQTFLDRPPHDTPSNEVINFSQSYLENFKKISLNENLYFTLNSDYKFIIQDVNNKNITDNKSISMLFNILCFIYTNQFFSALKKYDGEIESAYTPLLIKGQLKENEKGLVLNLLKEQERQVFILS